MTAGIYKITNINTGKMYIGSSKDIERRWKEHVHNLKNDKHHSYKLQRSYNSTKNKSVFQFEIIEEIEDQSKLKEREQYYIDLYDVFSNGYNCSAKVDNPKYTYKYEQMKEKSRIKDGIYQEFIELFNDYSDSLKFRNTFNTKLLDKQYSSSVYLAVNSMIKWFIEYYGVNYICHIFAQGNREYYLVVSDKNNNKFACYRYYQNEIYNSPYDTKGYLNTLKKKNIYDKKVHYIINVPDFNFN